MPSSGTWCTCVLQANTLTHKINHPLRKMRREIAHGWRRTKVRQGLAVGVTERRCGPSLPLEACAQALAKQRQQGGSTDRLCVLRVHLPPLLGPAQTIPWRVHRALVIPKGCRCAQCGGMRAHPSAWASTARFFLEEGKG